MKDSKTMLDQPVSSLAKTPIEAGQTDSRTFDADASIDAINRIFTEFELAYHNQYTKAFPTLEKLQYAKQLWFSHLKNYSPEQIVSAAHQAIQNSEFLPTIHGVVKYCEDEFSLYGLPDTRTAYIEACNAPSPKQSFSWSHPAVYHAGKASDWFFLANNTEAKAFPVFERNYQILCNRVRQGEQLEQPVPAALPESVEVHLTQEEQAERMKKIREDLKI